ncbi:MAG: 23S rRNA (guanosine(2251)-2'-O)-methyltransferase RlmB [Bacilli bacterium]|jgi:23S rRNA (guanosine2251-2'-O)-methyltransferase|nr:23S rRNA (guanosine(2251)-2'-O)-methyltransferase RlmB [Bacilli bacterium]NLN80039.1 23S rRNA (guanosine(2251)-2'-O)-methyltransferase RlmB [Erysipelotrichia bacterium]
MKKSKDEKINFKKMPNLIYGRKPVLSFLQTNGVEKIYLDERFSQAEILKEIAKQKVEVEKVTIKKLDELTAKSNHQGIAAIIKQFNYASLDEIIFDSKKETNPLIIMLDEIQDPHNFGAILRTCAYFNVRGVIIKKHQQVPLNATVAKVSTGALNFVKVCQVTNLSNALEILKDNGFWIVSTDLKEAVSFEDVDYLRPIVLILGSEGKGVSPLLNKRSDYVVKIPVSGKIQSLNVSVAAGILINFISSRKIK